MKSWLTVIDENRAELEAHITRIADIMQQAGACDPINRVVIEFPSLKMVNIEWNREGL